jgi:hypothetical protein
MITRTSKGYAVVSHSGKRLSKGNLSIGEAKKRLAQVEFFKHRAAKKGK